MRGIEGVVTVNLFFVHRRERGAWLHIFLVYGRAREALLDLFPVFGNDGGHG